MDDPAQRQMDGERDLDSNLRRIYVLHIPPLLVVDLNQVLLSTVIARRADKIKVIK